jgi:hypothetical protein
MDYVIWTLTVGGLLPGLAGTLAPVLIACAVLAHKLLLPEILSWWVVALCDCRLTLREWQEAAYGCRLTFVLIRVIRG